MNKLVRTCLRASIILLAAIFASFSADARFFGGDVNEDIGIIKRRLAEDYLSKSKHKSDEFYLTSANTNGSWPDVDYKNRGMADWKPIQHLNKMTEMCESYKDVKSKFYNSKPMLAAITKALNYWFFVQPKSDNWWNNTIGPQLQMEEILILVGNELPDSLMKKGIAYFVDPDHADKQWTTGQNLIWYSREQFTRGLLANNPKDVYTGLARIQGEIKITTEEGIEPDYSFHQHGAQLYNAGYGLAFLQDELGVAVLVRKTAFEFQKAKLEIISNYLLYGTAYMVRDKLIDYGADGRALIRQGESETALELIPVCEYLIELLPQNKEKYLDLINHINGRGKPYSFIGNKYFWNSDFIVHQRPGYYLSVKMISPGIVGTEIGNGENLKGSWMPFGLTYILRKGDEYKDIFPVWDWIKLPGITAYQDNYMEKQILVQTPECLAAGVSDGMYGAASMQLKRNSLKAKKSWFFFDDEVIALGAGISANVPQDITTSINQCLLQGDVYAGNELLRPGDHRNMKVAWVYNNGFGYVVLDGQAVNIKNDIQTGSWNSVSTVYPASSFVSKQVFSLWLDHGVRPLNKSYAYEIVPSPDVITFKRYAEGNSKITVARNDTTVQCVYNSFIKMAQMVFYRPASVKIDNDLTINCNGPALVIYSKLPGSRCKISVANTSSKASKIKLQVTTGQKSKSFDFTFPQFDGSRDITQTITSN